VLHRCQFRQHRVEDALLAAIATRRPAAADLFRH